MKANIYTVYDKVVEAFLMPFYSKNDRSAIRALTKPIMTDGHEFNVSPLDYDLYFIGVFDDLTGQIYDQQLKLVASLATLKSELKRDQELMHEHEQIDLFNNKDNNDGKDK